MSVLLHVGSVRWPGYFEACKALGEEWAAAGHPPVYFCTEPTATAWLRSHTPFKVYDYYEDYQPRSPRSRTLQETPELSWLPVAAITAWSRTIFNHADDRQALLAIYQTLRQALEIIAVEKPRLVVVFNGSTHWSATLAALAGRCGLPVWYYEKGFLPNSYQLDPRGVNGGGAMAATTESATKGFDATVLDAMRVELFGSGISGWQQTAERQGPEALRTRMGVTPDTRILLYIGQVEADTNLFRYSPWFRTNHDALEFLLKQVPADGRFFILGKKHPKAADDDARIRALLGNRGAWLSDVHLHDCLGAADTVVSINSSVIFEALLLHKRVMMLGRGIFSGKGVTFEYDGVNSAAAAAFLAGTSPAASIDAIDYWCNRIGSESLYRCRDADVHSEARRAVQATLAGLAPESTLTRLEEIKARVIAIPCETPELSIVIATRNRAGMLRGLLATLDKQTLDKALFEIIIVDNGSTDDTAVVACEVRQNFIHFKFLREPVPGVARARNAGIRAARGRWCAFLDDDTLPAPEWAITVMRSFHLHEPMPAAVCGPIRLKWMAAPPPWLTDDVALPLGAIDYGPYPRDLNPGEDLREGNSAFSTLLLRRHDGFDEKFGFKGDSLIASEGIELQQRIRREGHAVYYHPAMQIQHQVRPEVATTRWLLRRWFCQGISNAMMHRKDPSMPFGFVAFGSPRHIVWRTLLALVVLRETPASFRLKCGLAYNGGLAWGLLRSY